MALVNLSSPIISLPTVIPNYTYNTDILQIFKEDDEPVNTDNIYLSITELPAITNITTDVEEVPQWKKTLHKFFTISMGAVLVVLMLGMGAHVYWKEVLGNFWPPIPMLIGMCGQFVILPALAFGLTRLFQMSPYVALGCMITSCSPGGTFSNFFAYWVYGDVALSLVMTTCSTLLSFGTMPLNLWIYSSHIVGEDSERIIIPYINIVKTLGFVVGPVIVGMTIRHFSVRIADKTTKISSIIGYIMILFNVICTGILFGETLFAATWHLHVSVLILPLIGMFFAYFVAYILRRSHKVCRTICVETASQNMPVAFGIIILSFPEIEIRNEMLMYPSFYGLYMTSEIIIGALLFRLYYKRKEKRKRQKNEEVTNVNSYELEHMKI